MLEFVQANPLLSLVIAFVAYKVLSANQPGGSAVEGVKRQLPSIEPRQKSAARSQVLESVATVADAMKNNGHDEAAIGSFVSEVAPMVVCKKGKGADELASH